MIILKKTFMTIISFLMIFFTLNNYAACTKMINNKSNQPWTFSFSSTVILSDGTNCYFKPCIIPPKSKVIMTYHYDEHTDNHLSGVVTITAATSNQDNIVTKHFNYTYDGKTPDICPYISHDQKRTGGVSLNDPDNGGFAIEQDTW